MDGPESQVHLTLNPTGEILIPQADDSNSAARSPSLDSGFAVEMQDQDIFSDEAIGSLEVQLCTDSAELELETGNSPSLLPGPATPPGYLGAGSLPGGSYDTTMSEFMRSHASSANASLLSAPWLVTALARESTAENMAMAREAEQLYNRNIATQPISGIGIGYARNSGPPFVPAFLRGKPAAQMPRRSNRLAIKQHPRPALPVLVFSLMELPKECRGFIYKHILRSPRPINPHLCDKSAPVPSGTIPKFHDDNQTPHNAISLCLGILFVCKEVRAEALPIFYSANIFVIGKDTASYFDRLACLGRFDMVQNVQFSIWNRKEKYASETLKGMVSYLKAKKVHEDRLRAANEDVHVLRQKGKGKESSMDHEKEKKKPSTAALVGKNRATLRAHPQYLAGGLEDLNVAICLAKLCTAPFSHANTSTTTATHPSTLVLPVPFQTIFADFPALSWFPLVTHGLGMSLHLVPGVPLDEVAEGFITLTWRKRWGKKTHDEGEVERSLAAAEVERRALALQRMFLQKQTELNMLTGIPAQPGLPAQTAVPAASAGLPTQPALAPPIRSRALAYYRHNCDDEMEWYEIPAVRRGGISAMPGRRWRE